MTRQQQIAKLHTLLAQAEAANDAAKVAQILEVFRRNKVTPGGSPGARPQAPPTFKLFDVARATPEERLEHETFKRDAEYRLAQCTRDDHEEANRIKGMMRARGARPIGDDDSLWPAPEARNVAIVDDARGRSLQHGRRRPEGAIIEWTSAGWREWVGE